MKEIKAEMEEEIPNIGGGSGIPNIGGGSGLGKHSVSCSLLLFLNLQYLSESSQ